MERRAAPRIEISVELEGRKNGDVFLGTSVNVSETGILIRTNKALRSGDKITIRLVSPGLPEIVGIGSVVRDADLGLGRHGYAVQWDLTAEQKDALREMIQTSNE